MCKTIGYKLIYIWEHEWKNNQNEIKQYLINLLLNK